jgi:hypothetical protein
VEAIMTVGASPDSSSLPDEARVGLTAADRALLLVPTAVGLFFGVVLVVAGVPFARWVGYLGNDAFFYWLAGAATLGYGVALAAGLRAGHWRAIRAIVAAEVVFQAVTLLACALEIASGRGAPFVYLIVGAALVQLAIAIWLLVEHRGVPAAPPDLPGGGPALVVMLTAIAAATLFGVLGAFLPVLTAQFFGYAGTEVFAYRLAGAACLGYAVMGLLNLRSRAWAEVRLPVLMAIVFNGASFLVAIRALLQGDPVLMPAVVAVATLLVTVPMIYGFVTIKAGPRQEG